ncbi:hypothetical protein V8J08_002375 [Citrobacter amalonaticus]|uniref:hypothetical protein n=1 Tax=unclassified Citrobacter TaxID=2644389 RepID=UPI00076B273A|nr:MULTISPECIES: hypothetical protein [unclassified Citrobacter]AMH12478.1 hypothetical protein AL515_00750 [Citrobacter sp. FDAARGOS_156]AUZ63984.1 hypothetical protein C2U53_09085 [Citrobacter sp. CFNIH10]ECG5738446.1 hypothetical protein [Salmonella enterica subsp. enterica serovar Brunei]MDU7776378.1 hypothetical protein [Citrobacter sp.]
MTKKNDKQNDMNVWKRNNIPALEFCSLPRAAELLNCHLNDLIHFIQVGAIEICLALHDFEAALFTLGAWEESNEWEEKFPPKLMTKYTNKSPLSLFMPKAEFDMNPTATARVRRLYQNKDIPGLKKPILNLSGLWALSLSHLPHSFFNALKNNEEISFTSFNLSFKEADVPLNLDNYDDYVIMAQPLTEHLYASGLLNEADVKPIATITVKDIFITRCQIEKIYSYIGQDIPNFINGGVRQSQPNELMIEKSVPEVNTNKVGEFLEMLIRCVPELGDDVMKATANKRHSILSAFLERQQKEGKFNNMKMPASATIEKYFKI